MKRLLHIILLSFGLSVSAQQDPQNSFYFFNPLQFSPAYAGTRGTLQLVAAHRTQWLGWNGAPQTQFLAIDAPVARKRLGLGMNLHYDKIGARSAVQSMFNFAYHLPLNDKGLKLSMGISAGFHQNQFNFGGLLVNDISDPNYLQSFSATALNYGAGLYVYERKFYAGISAPRLLKRDLNDQQGNSILLPHIFLVAGYVYTLNSVIDIKPSILIKHTSNAPETIDLNASAFFYKKWWIGGMYRWHEALGFNMAFQINDMIMVGYAFDYPINAIRLNQWGNHELVLIFDITSKKSAAYSPRYF